jgi:uncharacterized protein YycO
MKLIFVRTSGFSSAAIRTVEGLRAGQFALAPWSHVAILNADEMHVIDSMWEHHGVSRRSLESFYEGFQEHLLVEIKTDPAREAEALAWLETQVGVPYDYAGLFGFVLGRNTQDGSKWYCFELAAEVMRRAGIPVSADRTDCFKLLRASLRI